MISYSKLNKIILDIKKEHNVFIKEFRLNFKDFNEILEDTIMLQKYDKPLKNPVNLDTKKLILLTDFGKVKIKRLKGE